MLRCLIMITFSGKFFFSNEESVLHEVIFSLGKHFDWLATSRCKFSLNKRRNCVEDTLYNLCILQAWIVFLQFKYLLVSIPQQVWQAPEWSQYLLTCPDLQKMLPQTESARTFTTLFNILRCMWHVVLTQNIEDLHLKCNIFHVALCDPFDYRLTNHTLSTLLESTKFHQTACFTYPRMPAFLVYLLN